MELVTMAQIADRLGISQSTISRALRDDPRVKAATRALIHETAREMGWRPDPALSALIAYRNKIRPRSNYGKIAVLHDLDREPSAFPLFMSQIIEGAREQAARCGYEIELFHVAAGSEEHQKLSRLLYHRGIRGIIVTPMRFPSLDLHWEHFCAVSVGENLTSPQLNHVVQDHDWMLRSAYRKLRELGYRRIGYCNDRGRESRQQEIYLGAYLKCLFLDGLPFEKFPPLFYDELEPWSPITWLKRYRFDAVIAMVPIHFIHAIAGTNYRVPDNLGVASLCDPAQGGHEDISGSVVDYACQGRVAIDTLQLALLHGRHGIPTEEEYRSVSLRGHWRDGSTTRPQDTATPKRKTRASLVPGI